MIRAYVRISSEKQCEGLSLQAQKMAIRKRFEGQEVKFYKDIKSGKNGNRKGLKKMLASLQRGDVVCCFKLDRISRSLIDLAKLLKAFQKKDVGFISCCEAFDTSSPSGLAMFRMLATFAEYESEIIGERTKNSMALLKKRGLSCGRAPFGFDKKGGKLVRNGKEQAIIQKILVMRDRDRMTFDEIASILNSELIPSKNNGIWYQDVVLHIYNRSSRVKNRGRIRKEKR